MSKQVADNNSCFFVCWVVLYRGNNCAKVVISVTGFTHINNVFNLWLVTPWWSVKASQVARVV